MFGIRSEPLCVEKITVAIADLPATLQGTKIVQLSDFHYGKGELSELLLAQAIDITNQQSADLVVLTGDFVTDDPNPIYKLVLKLKHIKSYQGIYAILGNHDMFYRRSQAVITRVLQQAGIQVLWNDIVYPFGKELPLVGLAEFWSREFFPGSILSQIDPAIPRIVLSHNPDTAAILQQWRVDLQLSGHTHGGQIILPYGIGALPKHLGAIRKYIPKFIRKFLPYLGKDCDKIVKNWQWSQGFHRVGDNYLYVNRGLGSYFPGRFNCPPEVTVITLTRK